MTADQISCWHQWDIKQAGFFFLHKERKNLECNISQMLKKGRVIKNLSYKTFY